MNTKIIHTVFLVVIWLSIIIGVVSYPLLPDRVVSHWNIEGEADGTMPKFWGVFLFPLVMMVLFLLYHFLPKIDPLKGIQAFRRNYDMLWIAMFVFFLYVFSLTIAWNLGYRFDFGFLIVPALAGLWYCIGATLEKTKRNWFVGIRTPWTLSSDSVWEKTHEFGARLFKAAALLLLIGILFPNKVYTLTFAVLAAVVIALVTVAYSYLLYRKEHS